MAYRYLNDFSSPACQQCVRFVTTVDLDDILHQAALQNGSFSSNIPQSVTSSSASRAVDPLSNPDGYRPVLNHIHQALAEVEAFVIQQHNQQMAHALRDRRPDVSDEDIRVFVRKCVRRQVEAAVYMPLRRTIFRIVYSFVATRSADLQRDMMILQSAEPSFFTVDDFVTKSKNLSKAVKALRDVVQAYLPADQCQLLMHAATAVAELHSECINHKRQQLAEISNKKETNTSNKPMITSVRASEDDIPIRQSMQDRPSSFNRLSSYSLDRPSSEKPSSRQSFDHDRGSIMPRGNLQNMSFDISKLFTRRKSMTDINIDGKWSANDSTLD